MATYQLGYTRPVVAQLLEQGGPFWWKVSHWARPFTAKQVRELLGWLEREATRRRAAKSFGQPGRHFVPAALFLVAFVDASLPDAKLEKTWRDAMAHLDGLNAHQYGSKKKRLEKLRSITRDATVLAAWQTAAVGSGWLPDPLLALLVIDASRSSLDAVMPHLERALNDPRRLAQFLAVRPAASARASSLFALIDQHSQQRPAMELGRRFGIERAGQVRVRLRIPAAQQTGAEQRFLELELDSTSEPDISLMLITQRVERGSSSERHQAIKASAVDHLPKAIARTRIGWNFAAARTSFVKRADCSALLAWLAGVEVNELSGG